MTLPGLGHPAVENVALPAKFTRRRFEAFLDQSNLPSACPQVLHASASYDFEGFAWNGVSFDQMKTPDCSAPEKLCFSGLSATWFEKK